MMFFNSPFSSRFSAPFFNPYYSKRAPSSYASRKPLPPPIVNNTAKFNTNTNVPSHFNNMQNNTFGSQEKTSTSNFNCNNKNLNNVLGNYNKEIHQIEDYNKEENRSVNQEEEPQKIFSILGFDLYMDDLIILGILYFLYTEEVDDPSLYISLILLLLS